jgi:hypothetical protein
LYLLAIGGVWRHRRSGLNPAAQSKGWAATLLGLCDPAPELVGADPETPGFAVECGTLHVDDARSASHVAAGAVKLEAQILALENLAGFPQGHFEDTVVKMDGAVCRHGEPHV